MSLVAQMNTSPDNADPTGGHASGLRILVAEDSSITQDLIKLVLVQRGHLVDIVEDGEAALNALRINAYDVVLLDFHLPKLDGVEVLAQFLSNVGDQRLPCFVAVTGDVEGLLAHRSNCEHFDRIVPKPLNIEEILSIIDEVSLFDGLEPRDHGASHEQKVSEEAPADGRKAQARMEKVAQFPRSVLSAISPDLHFLRWPYDFAESLMTGGVGKLDTAGFDGIVIEEPTTAAAISPLWQHRGLHLLPIIDLKGSLGPLADVDASKLSVSSAEQIEDTIERYHQRSIELHRDILQSDVLADKMLARMYVTGKPLEPFYSYQSLEAVIYNMPLESRIVLEEASKLAESGFLRASFFERFHICDDCGGSQFNVREECPVCRSSHLKEDSYLHHFKCAYQGPEADFLKGDELVCPKCRQRLTHFGSDYDKPGTVICCQSCGHSTSEPNVGFVCLSCGAHTDGDAIQTRDVFGYSLNDKAVDFLRVGQSYLGFTEKVLKFSDLPLDLVVSLNEEARLYNETRTPFALLEIGYERARELEREHGPRQFRLMREQFLENLRNLFSVMQSGPESKVVRGHSFDFALLHRSDPARVRTITDDLIAQAVQNLRVDLKVKITVFGPGDLF
ncbi:response regulator [uncultured Cohaesibacter sp.]|uniref:TackOD1 domain-containing metal-binding protein n=1 Tax=uncultured Cohaesibacter sp. TaxID=1002546 RepID=UPI0029C61721|nr:response regulator [uncultured Cohaesibacter sp.]